MIFPQIFRFGSLHLISLAGEFGQQSNLARAMILLLFSSREKRSKKASVFHSLLWVALLPASRVGGAWFSGLRPALPMVGEPAAALRRRPRRNILFRRIINNKSDEKTHRKTCISREFSLPL